MHKKGRNEGNRENTRTRKGFKNNILTTSQYWIHRDIDRNKNMACRTKNTIFDIDVVS